MKKIKVLEELSALGVDEMYDLADRLKFALANRLADNDNTREFYFMVLSDIVEDYKIDREEKAL